MNNSGVSIQYGDIAPEAKENFYPTATEQEVFVNLEQLQQYNLNFSNYINPCELNLMVLNGNGQPFPDAPENENMGLWSVQTSGEDGTFETPIAVSFVADAQYSSQGLTLTFDTYNNIFANDVNIKWYRDEELLSDMDFAPNTPEYFCQNKVTNYNRLLITFYSLNMPFNRLKFRAIDYGHRIIFRGNELRNVNLIQEIDPISTQIAINTADFTLDSKSNEYSFQAKQPLNIYFNGELQATTFVRGSRRNSRFLWQIESEDYIGILDSVPFNGGMYVDKNADELLTEIFNTGKVPFYIGAEFKDITLTGYIPYTTCRGALMQVSFAVQAVVDTSHSSVVKVYALNDEVTQTIPLKRIMQGQSFTTEETITGVELAAHSYKEIEESVDVYDAIKSGAGQNIFVKFSEPLHSLTITNGEIVSRETNYAIINADAECVLTGKKYEHTTIIKRYNNPLVLASDLEKVVAIEGATLVNQNNVDKLLERCYNYIVNADTVNCKIVEGKHVQDDGSITYDRPVRVGDVIKSQTEYLGEVQGRIIKQRFSLNGGIIIKDSVLRQGG